MHTVLLVFLSRNRVVVVNCALNAVDQDWLILHEIQLPINQNPASSVGGVEVDVHHSNHVDIKNGIELIIETGEYLDIPDFIGVYACQVKLKFEVIHATVVWIRVGTQLDDRHSAVPGISF